MDELIRGTKPAGWRGLVAGRAAHVSIPCHRCPDSLADYFRRRFGPRPATEIVNKTMNSPASPEGEHATSFAVNATQDRVASDRQVCADPDASRGAVTRRTVTRALCAASSSFGAPRMSERSRPAQRARWLTLGRM